ncbi:MAG: glycosyltransferase [bacterium]|nr:glycosyltransferase [bacterium]
MLGLILFNTIVVLAILNLLRIGIFLISADLYEYKLAKQKKIISHYRPLVSIIIPAHNEEICIIATVQSALYNDYHKKEIIVVDDGSVDRTYSKLKYFKYKNKLSQLKIVRQANLGKAVAINNAIKNQARGSLIMVLDADSKLDKHAVTNMVKHFSNRNIIAAAANVKIISNNTLLGLAQRIEYIISYHSKRALTILSMEYIIGGVGSTFRKIAVKSVEYYDTDTITEDIDFTLKLIFRKGNKGKSVFFAADVLAYTEPVLKFSSLVKQRYRWKYGRMQTFVKHKSMFFSRQKKYDKRLTMYQLPYAILGELTLFIEPILLTFIILMSFVYGDSKSLMGVYIIITAYITLNIFTENTESLKSKLSLIPGIPAAYVLMYVVTVVEFYALIKSILRMPKLLKPGKEKPTWEHVERAGATI